MSGITTWIKDPEAVLDYKVDWARWLQVGEAISTATFDVPTGLTMDSSDKTGSTATVWLSGGVVGTTYRVVCEITTTGGRTDDRSFLINVQER